MLEYAKDHFGKDTLWTFQQDGATSTLQTSPKIGVETIFQIFGPKKCGLHILIPWIFWCGLSLKARPVKKFTTLLMT